MTPQLLDNAVSAIAGSMRNWLKEDKETGPETEKGKAIAELAQKFYFDNFAGKESLYLFTVAIGVLIGILAENLMELPGIVNIKDGPAN